MNRRVSSGFPISWTWTWTKQIIQVFQSHAGSGEKRPPSRSRGYVEAVEFVIGGGRNEGRSIVAYQPVKRKIIAVIGSGGSLSAEQRAGPFAVGAWIARHQYHLLTGGGAGVMAAASEGFCSVERSGLSVGVIPSGRPADVYPNPWIELPVFTHLKGEDPWGADSRNHIIVRSCHALVAFPGQTGTQSELELALMQPSLKGAIVACLGESDRIGRLDRNAVSALGIAVATDSAGAVDFLSEFMKSWT